MMERKQQGFTIIELLLAMSFFSFIMLFVVVGFVQINRSFNRGLTTREVQNTTRSIVDDLSAMVRRAENSGITGDATPGNLQTACLGTVRYAWNMPSSDTEVSITNHQYNDVAERVNLVKTTGPACSDPVEKNPVAGETVSVLPDDLMVQHLSVTRLAANSPSYRIVAVISTSYLEDFDTFGIDARCSVQKGDEFCDVAKIETVVSSRN